MYKYFALDVFVKKVKNNIRFKSRLRLTKFIKTTARPGSEQVIVDLQCIEYISSQCIFYLNFLFRLSRLKGGQILCIKFKMLIPSGTGCILLF